MNCPTCGHEMQPMGCRVTADTLYYCVDCGTLKPCNCPPIVPARAAVNHDLLVACGKAADSMNCCCSMLPWVGDKPPCLCCELNAAVAKAKRIDP
jgi:hypothetical protein